MNTLNPNIPSTELSRLMTTAVSKLHDYQLLLLTPQLLLRTFLDDQTAVAHQILRRLQKERGFDWDDLVRRVEQVTHLSKGRDAQFNFTDDFGKDYPLADETLVVLDEGLTIAQSREELKVNSGHALAAMAQKNVTTYAVLQRVGVTSEAVIELLAESTAEGMPIIFDYVDEAKRGQAQAVYQREALLNELISLLALANQRHVILVGPEGAGKRTLVYSLAQLLAEGKGPADLRSVVEINEPALLENPLATMRVALRRSSGGILLVPGIERFFADRIHARLPENVTRELHKAMLGSEHVIIGTAVPGIYDRLNADPIIRQNTQRLDVPAATKTEATAMLLFHQQRLEQEYEIEVTREGLETAVTLAGQYIKTIALPAAAVQLADRACALVRLVTQEHVANLPQVAADGTLSPDDVMVAASQMTKIPIAKLNADERGKYANMVDHLHQRIIGQDEAILAVSRAVKTARVGLRDPKRPIGSFLFLGPSGVGKTELAKALAEFMFGTEQAMLVLDMSEYQEEASVNRLIGSPPGYVGHEAGGQLTNFVRERPYTVVLFDEVEKAHERVFDVLLQVLEEGRLTDSQGRLATFSETVVIMTSNLGSKHMLVPVIGEHERELVLDEVHHFFRPEFLNRLDEIILFHQLSGDQLALILDLMLKKELQLAGAQGIELQLTDAAKQWLLAQNDEPQYGARPLRRIIARHLREPLADFLLREGGERQPGSQTTITIDATDKGLDFQM
ncbi:MAG: ATP-dependent Clp protease ATP-binding subunit [Ardenticatenaceae bacterium]|nr:ATP-dependent Clp protease ATP-binding subunit [Ardenticatenaceae bacterium]MCB8986654.1 ATP-dependent Clp protease ATP-binding subunit [Ardenticatenaceae bacterium]